MRSLIFNALVCCGIALSCLRAHETPPNVLVAPEQIDAAISELESPSDQQRKAAITKLLGFLDSTADFYGLVDRLAQMHRKTSSLDLRRQLDLVLARADPVHALVQEVKLLEAGKIDDLSPLSGLWTKIEAQDPFLIAVHIPDLLPTALQKRCLWYAYIHDVSVDRSTLEKFLKSEDADLRAVAIRLLGQQSAGSNLPAIYPFLFDKSATVRGSTAAALASMHDTGALKDLEKAFQQEPDFILDSSRNDNKSNLDIPIAENAKEQMVNALADLGGNPDLILPLVQKYCRVEDHASIACTALSALRKLHAPQALPIVRAIVDGKEEGALKVYFEAIRCLGPCGGKAVLIEYSALLDRDNNTAMYLARELLDYDVATGEAWLKRQIPNGHQPLVAAGSLAAKGNAEAIQFLSAKALNTENKIEQELALRLLVQAPTAPDILNLMKKASHPQTGDGAFLPIVLRAGTPDALAYVIQCLNLPAIKPFEGEVYDALRQVTAHRLRNSPQLWQDWLAQSKDRLKWDSTKSRYTLDVRPVEK